MDILVYDGSFCLICSTPSFCCNCEFSDSSWSNSASQELSCTFREESTNFDMGGPAFCATTDGGLFPDGPFENPDFEVDNNPCPGSAHGSQHPCPGSTPKNNGDVEKWESPSATTPPESSSPVGFDADSSPLATDLSVAIQRPPRVDPAMDQRLLCPPPTHGGPRHATPPYKHPADSNTPIFPTTMSMRYSPPFPIYTLETVSSWDAAPGYQCFDDRPTAIHYQQSVASAHDVCTRAAIEPTDNLEESDRIDGVYALRHPTPAPCEGSLFPGSTITSLGVSNELEAALEDVTDDGGGDATTSEAGRDDGVPLEILSPTASVFARCRDQATTDNRLKRRRSSESVDDFQEFKKAKLNRTVSHVSCSSNPSVQPRYQATRPASLRRAESLTSEISSYSRESMVRSWSLCG